MASSLARYKRCHKPVNPEAVKCTYVEPPAAEENEPFPWFTKDLYVSVFKQEIPDPRPQDDKEMDHNDIIKFRSHLSTGRLGETVTAVRKDLLKYPCGHAPKPDVSRTVAVTAMRASAVDYLDCVRAVIMHRRRPIRENASPFICHVLLSFRSRLPYQTEYYYMVSEYWSHGSSVCLRLQNLGKFTENIARFYVMELADALIYLHGRNLLVRRLCICNLLLDPKGYVRLACYSLCEHNLDIGNASNMLHQNCGDQFYSSPEVVFGVDAHPEADWWSFGVILFQMLTGELPFTGRTLGDLGKAITESPMPTPPGLQGEVCALLKHLLHKDPRRRLGWGRDGSRDVKCHPWFKGHPWEDVRDASQVPPYHPIDDDNAILPQKKILNKAEVNTKKEILRKALDPPVTGPTCNRLGRKV